MLQGEERTLDAVGQSGGYGPLAAHVKDMGLCEVGSPQCMARSPPTVASCLRRQPRPAADCPPAPRARLSVQNSALNSSARDSCLPSMAEDRAPSASPMVDFDLGFGRSLNDQPKRLYTIALVSDFFYPRMVRSTRGLCHLLCTADTLNLESYFSSCPLSMRALASQGGVEMHQYSLAQCLIKRGHKVILITGTYRYGHLNCLALWRAIS